MTAEKILRDTLIEHEADAPDEVAVRDELRRRTTQRRSRLPRSLAPLAAAAAVLAIVVGAVVVVGGQPDRSAVPTARGSAAGTAPAGPARKATSSATPTSAAALPVLTIGPGWLPGTMTQVQAEAGDGNQQREYSGSVDGSGLSVILTSEPAALPTRAKQGALRPITVAGRAGVEAVTTGHYQLAFRTSRPGTVAHVFIDADDARSALASVARLRELGRRVAAAMQFDRADPIAVSAVLTYLPTGTVIDRLSSDHDGRGYTDYTLTATGAAGTGVGSMPAMVQIDGTAQGSVLPAGPAGGTAGRPGRTVQGHPTTVSTDGGTTLLTISGLGPGVTLNTGPGAPTLAALYRIADGVSVSG